MTISAVLEIGDDVLIEVRPELTRSDRYDDVPNGTKGVICGFAPDIYYQQRIYVSGRKPGAYSRKGYPIIWLDTGRVVSRVQWFRIIDKELENLRYIPLTKPDGTFRIEEVYLGDLPETKFWEHDKVRVLFPDGSEHDTVVTQIIYHLMHQYEKDGSPSKFYQVEREGNNVSVGESSIELIERGNVWKFYNKQPLSFIDLKEEATFFHLIGQTEDVPNPIYCRYRWTEEQALEAVTKGLVHGFGNKESPYPIASHVNALLFKDGEVGRRIAEATLKGFRITH